MTRLIQSELTAIIGEIIQLKIMSEIRVYVQCIVPSAQTKPVINKKTNRKALSCSLLMNNRRSIVKEFVEFFFYAL